jgi:glycosyltransferase involved in cell wall biosynthesis
MLTHNRPLSLPRAVRSVLSQTFADFEFILVDNGSSDKTQALCRQLVSENPGITLIRREGSNIGAGRNAGLDAARAPYAAFVDDDDYAYPDMLKFLYDLAAGHHADIAFCGSDKEVPGRGVVPQFVFGGPLVLTPEEAVIELLERRTLNLATPTKLFKTSIFRDLRFSETDKYDDISMTYKLFASAGVVAAHGAPHYCFVRHLGNNSGFTNSDKLLTPEQLEAYFAVYRERTAWLSAKLPAIRDYVNYSEWSFFLSMYRKIVVNGLTNCEKQRIYLEGYLEKAGGMYLASPWIKDFELEYMGLCNERIGKAG